MWVRFTRDFDFTPKAERRVTMGYKLGQVVNVTRECRDLAVEKGAAVDTRSPAKRNPAPEAEGGEHGGGQAETAGEGRAEGGGD